MMRTILVSAVLACIAMPAMAQVRIVPDQPADAPSATQGIDVFVMNEGPTAETAQLPTRLSVTAKDGSAVTLYREGDATVAVAAGGFAKWRYRNVDPHAIAERDLREAEAQSADAQAALAAAQGEGVAATAGSSAPQVGVRNADVARLAVEADFAERRAAEAARAADALDPGKPMVATAYSSDEGGDIDHAKPSGETGFDTASGGTAAFVDRFLPYEPIYGVFGLNDAGAKLQVSFAFRPFDGAGVLDGLRFAWTQTSFWAIQEPSGPFRENDYSPELFYELPVGNRVTAAFGYRHTSNGEGPATSIDVNRIYARAAFRFDLGGNWQAELVPQAWFYVGGQGVAPDLDRYWGYTSLAASIGQRDGIKVTGTLRGNPGTGKAGGELLASYPLTRLGGGFGIYLFGQVYSGFGESLNDYDRNDTHARLGISLTR